MKIGRYRQEDLKEVLNLFYNTVHQVNKKDYRQEQLDVWAPETAEVEEWNKTLLDHYSIVAKYRQQIVGFGDIDDTGYLDRLYVHKDYQGRGIASKLCDELELRACGKRIVVHASITAEPFFHRRGYQVIKEQQVEKKGIFLIIFIMEKQTGGMKSE